jgi:acetyl-CoA acetyltransferase
MASGIRDKVAIVGMGCSRFGERWDCGPDELMLEAFNEGAGRRRLQGNQMQAAWLGVCLEENNVGKTAGPLAQALRLPRIAATRVENACATGTEALRGAAYAVAAGAYDIVLAMGVEKLKDTGYGGLPVRTRGVANDLWLPNATAPGAFAQLASAYAAKHGVDMKDLKRAMAHISVKSHANAALNPKAHLRNAITEDDVLKADHRRAAGPVRLLRRQRRRGLRHRHHARDRAGAAARARGGDDQGAGGVGQQRRGAGLQRPAGTARTSPPRAKPVPAPMPAPASPTRARRSTWPRCTTAFRSPRRC